jgi:hypothetical protein
MILWITIVIQWFLMILWITIVIQWFLFLLFRILILFLCGYQIFVCFFKLVLSKGEQKNRIVKKNRLKFWKNRPVLKKKKPEKTEPNRKNRPKIEPNQKNQAKPVWTGCCPKKPNQNQSVWTGFGFFKKKFRCGSNQTENDQP